MQKSIVHKFYKVFAALLFYVLLAGLAQAQVLTIHLTDGNAVSGEMVSSDEKGFLLKLADGTFGDHIAWGKVAQADLRELDQNPKLRDFVEPFIEITQADRIKRTEIVWKDVPKLERPAHHSLFGALFGSGIGIFILLIVYAGNIYAGYEVSIFRGQQTGLVCGVSAVLPLIGPIIFLSMAPKVVEQKAASWATPTAADVAITAAAAADMAAAAAAEGALQETVAAEGQASADAPKPKAALPPTKTYARGQFTFNRRFFETQLAKYFAIVRSDEEKEMVLSVRAARGSYVATRISRISANDLQLQVAKGGAFEDVTIPFTEIQEVQVKHRDA